MRFAGYQHWGCEMDVLATSERARKLAYSKGYAAGMRGNWPSHKPPHPPTEVIAGLMKAINDLRDCADAICATLDPQDDFVLALGPKIDEVDGAMSKVKLWLMIPEEARAG